MISTGLMNMSYHTYGSLSVFVMVAFHFCAASAWMMSMLLNCMLLVDLGSNKISVQCDVDFVVSDPSVHLLASCLAA